MRLKKQSTLKCGDEVTVSARRGVYLPKACMCDAPNISAGIVFVPARKQYTHVIRVGDDEYYHVCNLCYGTVREKKGGKAE